MATSTKLKNMLCWTPKYDDLDKIIETAYKWELSEKLEKWRELKK